MDVFKFGQDLYGFETTHFLFEGWEKLGKTQHLIFLLFFFSSTSGSFVAFPFHFPGNNQNLEKGKEQT